MTKQKRQAVARRVAERKRRDALLATAPGEPRLGPPTWPWRKGGFWETLAERCARIPERAKREV